MSLASLLAKSNVFDQIGVSIGPGSIAETRIPQLRTSSRKASVMASIAFLAYLFDLVFHGLDELFRRDLHRRVHAVLLALVSD